jgi:hypothetical protein
VLCCKVPLAIETPIVIAQEPPASASEPSSSASAIEALWGLVACEYAVARASAHQVLQFLDKMKNTADDRDGEHCN